MRVKRANPHPLGGLLRPPGYAQAGRPISSAARLVNVVTKMRVGRNAFGYQPGDAPQQHGGFARPRPGKNQCGPLRVVKKASRWASNSVLRPNFPQWAQ